jgi:GrpB-like predicted nucleotidyltransferase (UPF0157 family)
MATIYIFKPYNPDYPQLFLEEKERLNKFLNNKYQIEHVGSTAVPNLGGKGLVDILIVVPRKNMDEISNTLQELGYEFRPLASNDDRYFFRYTTSTSFGYEQRYNLHLTFPESGEAQRMISFRDYLRKNSAKVKEYEDIKKDAVRRFKEEGKKYRDYKEEFVKEIEKLKN